MPTSATNRTRLPAAHHPAVDASASSSSCAASSASSAGTWTSTGAIADSGTFATTFVNSGNPAPGALAAVVHADSTLTSTSGTITLRHTSVQTLVSPIEINLNGPVQIVSGTGAYDGIKGYGTMDLSLYLTNGTLTATVDGVPAGQRCRLVVVARDGSRAVAGSWLVSPAGEHDGTTLHGSAIVPPDQVAAVLVENEAGREFVVAPA